VPERVRGVTAQAASLRQRGPVQPQGRASTCVLLKPLGWRGGLCRELALVPEVQCVFQFQVRVENQSILPSALVDPSKGSGRAEVTRTDVVDVWRRRRRRRQQRRQRRQQQRRWRWQQWRRKGISQEKRKRSCQPLHNRCNHSTASVLPHTLRLLIPIPVHDQLSRTLMNMARVAPPWSCSNPCIHTLPNVSAPH
jgi:hypothetical protein